MDDELRRAERDFISGEPGAEERWIRLCARAGRLFRDFPSKKEILTEAEDAQADFDDVWWHGKRGLRCGLWGSNGIHSFWDVDFKPSVYKAHHSWGHKGSFGDQNAKRKTLRTHRDGSRKNFRLRDEVDEVERDEAPHERRRKKRFGGRERLYGREWVWRPEGGYKIVHWCRVPDLDG